MNEEKRSELQKLLFEAPEIIAERYFKDDQGNAFKCTSYQKKALREIFLRENSKFIICAATQSGKSEVISIVACLLALMSPNERIAVVSYTEDQSKIIFDKAKKHLVEDNAFIKSKIDSSKEFSRKTIHLKNGSQIKCYSSGVSEFGSESLLGFNATVLIIDESASISDDIYSTKIIRMLGAARQQKLLIESGTPHAKNHFYRSWSDQSYARFHWPWELAVKEGQMNQEIVNVQKRNMTPTQFQMFYSAEFPEQSEKGLFSLKEIERNIIESRRVFEGTSILSADIARFGRDWTVLTLFDLIEEVFYVREIKAFEKQDTMATAGRIASLVKEFHFDSVIVDVVGLGGGVADRLQEQSIDVEELNAGSSPQDSERFSNLKAELYFTAKQLFEEDKIKIIRNQKLIDELLAIEVSYTSDGKLKINDPAKSPDYADSMVYGLAARSSESWDEAIY